MLTSEKCPQQCVGGIVQARLAALLSVARADRLNTEPFSWPFLTLVVNSACLRDASMEGLRRMVCGVLSSCKGVCAVISRNSFASVAASLALVISAANAFHQTSQADRTGPTGQSQSALQAVIGRAFTYQGRLNDNGAPANGAYDFEFALYDAPVAGAQLGAINALSNVTVTSGLFTVQLDFGNPFWQQMTWLEARVRRSGGGSFTTLAPRQPLTAAPVASALPGVFADSGGQFVGIGRSNRITGREVFGINADFGVPDSSGYGGMYINTVLSTGLPFYGYATANAFRAWTTYNPSPDNVPAPDLNDGAWEVHTGVSWRPLVQVRDNRVAQQVGAHGLVKAGALVNCSASSASISRSFVSIVTPAPGPAPAVSVVFSNTLDACVIDFGFNISQRYFVATARASDARFVACDLASVTALSCKRFRADGARENGSIMVMIY